VSKRLGSGAGVNHAFLQLDLEQKLKFNVVVKHCGLVRLCRLSDGKQVSSNLIKMISMASTSQEQEAVVVPVNVDLDFLINKCRSCKLSYEDKF
jgi:hypothetical protein